MVLALLLRLVLVNSQSLTMDEAYDLETARSGWRGILAANNRFPPLYHCLLQLWWLIAPWDETGRIFSAVCGTLLVGVVGQLGQTIGGRTTRLWAALLCAVSPYTLWYSLETRVYSLYLLLAAVSLWQFTVALQYNRPSNWLGYSLASLAGVYTHYYFGLLIASSGILLLWEKRNDWPELRFGLQVYFALGILCLPVLWFLQQDLDQPWGFARTSHFSLGALGYTFFSFFSGYSLGPSLRELHQLSSTEALSLATPWLVILGLPVAGLFGMGFLKNNGQKYFGWKTMVLALGVAPILLVGGVSIISSSGYNVRHALWCQIPLLVTVARGIAQGRPRWLTVSSATLVCMGSTIAIFNHHFDNKYRHEDARAVIQYLTKHSDLGTPLFVLSGYMTDPFNHYLRNDQKSIPLTLDHQKVEAGASMQEMINERIGVTGKFWLAYTREFHGDPQGKLLQSLQQTYSLELAESFAGIKLYQGTLRAPDASLPNSPAGFGMTISANVRSISSITSFCTRCFRETAKGLGSGSFTIDSSPRISRATRRISRPGSWQNSS